MQRIAVLVGVAGWLAVACAPPPPPPGDPVIAVAGDIACAPSSVVDATHCQQRATARLITGDPHVVAVQTLGDNQYSATAANYAGGYGTSWGVFQSITHPAVGNHDLCCGAPKGSPYYDYWGSAAGAVGQAYYSYDLGTWHIAVTNDECASVTGGCAVGSPQEKWLKADLAAHPAVCTAVVAHNARYSSGNGGDNPSLAGAFFQDAVAAHADLFLSGNSHEYERFAPADNANHASPSGVRQFVVGTGGRDLQGFSETSGPTQVRQNTSFGVLKLTLHPRSYDWEFVSVGGRFSDSGTASCNP